MPSVSSQNIITIEVNIQKPRCEETNLGFEPGKAWETASQYSGIDAMVGSAVSCPRSVPGSRGTNEG